jgi:hypothetical protein
MEVQGAFDFLGYWSLLRSFKENVPKWRNFYLIKHQIGLVIHNTANRGSLCSHLAPYYCTQRINT